MRPDHNQLQDSTNRAARKMCNSLSLILSGHRRLPAWPECKRGNSLVLYLAVYITRTLGRTLP
jgi:hypothetical protein